MTTALFACLALVAAEAIVVLAIVGVASHQERVRRRRSPAMQARRAEARIQATTNQRMHQMMDVARQTMDQQRRR